MSPLHVWHLLSVAKSVRQAVDFVRNSPIMAGERCATLRCPGLCGAAL